MKLLILLCALVSYTSANSCGVSPQFWCDSEAIAIKCGVVEACSSRLFPSNLVTEATQVNVVAYFESYCADSIHFITTQLYPTWEALKSSGIMKVAIVPFGKAQFWKKPDGSYAFRCQQGAKECKGNTIENCLLHYAKFDTKSYLPIVNCMEINSNPDQDAQKCITEGGYEWEVINTCAAGAEGNELLHQAGLVTQNMVPELNWVPWVVVNGVHTDAIQSAATTDLLKLVCDTYEGVKPDACQQSQKIKFVPGSTHN